MGHEGDEGHESHEGNEGHEGEEGVDHRQGEARTVGCVPREQGEDHRGPAEDRLDEEQDREGREQEGPRQWQEGLRPHQGLDHGRAEGTQGAWRDGLPGGEEGLPALQEGQGDLWPVNTRRSLLRESASGTLSRPPRCGEFYTRHATRSASPRRGISRRLTMYMSNRERK